MFTKKKKFPVDLDEPFSESEDDASKGPRKMMLPIPRGRIRTLSGTIPAVGYRLGLNHCISLLEIRSTFV